MAVAVTDRALLSLPSYICDLHFHHLDASLACEYVNSLILSRCNYDFLGGDLKVETLGRIPRVFCLEQEFERKLFGLQVLNRKDFDSAFACLDQVAVGGQDSLDGERLIFADLE